MKRSPLLAILSDAQFWAPVVVLIIGLLVLVYVK